MQNVHLTTHTITWDYDSPMANIIHTKNSNNNIIISDKNQYGDTYYAFHLLYQSSLSRLSNVCKHCKGSLTKSKDIINSVRFGVYISYPRKCMHALNFIMIRVFHHIMPYLRIKFYSQTLLQTKYLESAMTRYISYSSERTSICVSYRACLLC